MSFQRNDPLTASNISVRVHRTSWRDQSAQCRPAAAGTPNKVKMSRKACGRNIDQMTSRLDSTTQSASSAEKIVVLNSRQTVLK